MDTIKDRIKKLCDSKGTTIAQLEKELKFGNGTIARWDKSQPRTNKLNAVAVYFNVPVQALTGDPLPEQKENPVTFNSDEEYNDAIRRSQYAYFIDLLDRSTPEARDEAVALLISRLHNRVNQDEQK